MSDEVRVTHLLNYFFLFDLHYLDVQKSLHLDSRMLGVSKNWNSKACEEEMFCMQLPFEKNT